MDIIHLRKQVLKEASYKYAMPTSQGGVAWFGRSRGVSPNIIAIPLDRKSLKDSEHIAVVRINNAAGNKMWDEAVKNNNMGRYTPETKKFIDLWSVSRSNEFSSLLDQMGDYPTVFKINELKGKPQIFKHMTTDFGMPAELYEKWFGDPPEELDDDHFTEFHGARVFVPESTRAATKKSMISVLETLFEHLKASGFGFLFHGDIRFIPLSGGTVGTYNIPTKTIAIHPNAKATKDVIFALLHEFSHKYWYEYMDDSVKRIVRMKFISIRREGNKHDKQDDELHASIENIKANLKPGMEVEYLGRKKVFKDIKHFIIKEVDKDGSWSAYAATDPNQSVRVTGSPGVFTKKQWDLKGVENKEISKTSQYDHVSSDWFPSAYSQTNEEEWWAELMAMYLLDNLKGEPEEFLHEVFGV